MEKQYYGEKSLKTVLMGLRTCMSRKFFAIGFCFVFLSLMIPRSARAFLDTLKMTAFNSGAFARGGTAVAIGVDEPTNMNFNPAVISETLSNTLDLNLLFTTADFDFVHYTPDGTRENDQGKDRICVIPHVGYAHHIEDSRWTWGIAMAVVDGFGCDYTFNSNYFGPVNTYSEMLHMRISPALSYQITPELAFGTRIGLDYGSLDMRIPFGIAKFDLGQCDGFGFSLGAGFLYKPSDKWSFGIYYSNTFMNDLRTKNDDGSIAVDFDGSGPGGITYFSKLDVRVKNFDFPQHYGAGFAYRPNPSWRLSADIKYINWKRNWDQLELVFDGEAVPLKKIKFPVHIDDQTPLSLGLEYFFGEDKKYSAIIGFHYNDEAMTENYLIPIVPAEVQYQYSCGFSVKPAETCKFGIAFIYGDMDDPHSKSQHAYDKAIAEQFGRETIDSELNNSKVKYAEYNIQLSFVQYW